jgi:hypothetical protein
MKKINFVFSLLFLAFMFLCIDKADASNYVKIATIGVGSPAMNKSLTPQEMVEQMLTFWKRQLAQVLPDNPDLIVLPEVCDQPSGLNNSDEMQYLKIRGNQFLNYMASVAKESHSYIAFGTTRLDEKGNWRNSCILLNRLGEIAGIYDKNFITFRGVEFGTKAGNTTPIFNTDFGTVGCIICFDLNFDELRQKYASLKPDILLFPSMYHGGLVQSYWAYSCESYFVGSMGGTNVPSEIRNPMGTVVATSTNHFRYAVTTVNLDYKLVHLDQNWGKLSALKKKYGRDVTIYDPGRVGAVMITSESDSISAKDMVKEFDIELLGDYLNRSRTFR